MLQVESSLCVTGGIDGQIRIWDLDAAEAAFPNGLASPPVPTSSLENVFLGRGAPGAGDDFFSAGGAGLVNGGLDEDGMMKEQPGKEKVEESGPCVRTLDGHTKAVTSLYFDGPCLVRAYPSTSYFSGRT